MIFRIVRLEVTEAGEVMGRKDTQPLYESRAHANAMAEVAAAHFDDHYVYDDATRCWCVRGRHERGFRFVVEPVALDDDVAA